MRHINERGIQIVKSFEGLSLKAYLCPAKVWTIGYGSTTGSDGRPVDPDMEPVTEADADALASAGYGTDEDYGGCCDW